MATDAFAGRPNLAPSDGLHQAPTDGMGCSEARCPAQISVANGFPEVRLPLGIKRDTPAKVLKLSVSSW